MIWEIFLYEMLGTLMLVSIGTSVNAGVTLKKTYSNKSGWVVVALGWGFAIMIGAAIANQSGGVINPAMGLIKWMTGDWGVGEFFMAFLAQMIGAIIGALITTGIFWSQFNEEDEAEKIRGIFATGPANNDKSKKGTSSHFLAEGFGTFVLGLALFLPIALDPTIEWVTPIYAGLVVVGIGLSFGAATGFAINPARDLGPRIVYSLVPFKVKTGADWSYSWVPIVAPFVGAAFAGGLVLLV